jgi:hypothetical protein
VLVQVNVGILYQRVLLECKKEIMERLLAALGKLGR